MEEGKKRGKEREGVIGVGKVKKEKGVATGVEWRRRSKKGVGSERRKSQEKVLGRLREGVRTQERRKEEGREYKKRELGGRAVKRKRKRRSLEGVVSQVAQVAEGKKR